MGSEVTHTHMDTHTQSTCLMDFLWNCLKMLAQSRAGSFVSYMLPFCPHRVWYITEKHNFKLNCNFKVDTPPPPTPQKNVLFAVEQLIPCCLCSYCFFRLIWFSVWMGFSSDLWTCAQRLHCASASRVHVLQHALVQLHLRLSPALSCTLTHQHILTCWDIGFAGVLHRSASPDSSLKCPWQPPNPQPSFPLCSCTFSSSTRLLMDAAILLCLSPLECSHNHWAL